MAIKSDKAIYQVLEARLRAAASPLTCKDLMNYDDVRTEAIAAYGKDIQASTNQVSNALGLMWRRGLLTRFPAPRSGTTYSKFAYIWATTIEAPVKPMSPPVRLVGKTPIGITEHADCVEIEFEKFTILVRPKQS